MGRWRYRHEATQPDQRARHSELVIELRQARDHLATAVDVYNAALETAATALREATQPYNDVMDRAGEFAGDCGGEIDVFRDDRSEAWQESPAGQAVAEWSQVWSGFGGEEYGFDEPSPADEPDDETVEDFEQLPLELE